MSQHNSSHAASHGGDDHDHDIAAHVRTYLIIFGALLVEPLKPRARLSQLC
jgi:hypothetical protein